MESISKRKDLCAYEKYEVISIPAEGYNARLFVWIAYQAIPVTEANADAAFRVS